MTAAIADALPLLSGHHARECGHRAACTGSAAALAPIRRRTGRTERRPACLVAAATAPRLHRDPIVLRSLSSCPAAHPPTAAAPDRAHHPARHGASPLLPLPDAHHPRHAGEMRRTIGRHRRSCSCLPHCARLCRWRWRAGADGSPRPAVVHRSSAAAQPSHGRRARCGGRSSSLLPRWPPIRGPPCPDCSPIRAPPDHRCTTHRRRSHRNLLAAPLPRTPVAARALTAPSDDAPARRDRCSRCPSRRSTSPLHAPVRAPHRPA